MSNLARAPPRELRYKQEVTVMIPYRFLLPATVASLFVAPLAVTAAPTGAATTAATSAQLNYRTVKVENVEVFYREAGPKDAPVLLLLHGFPTSSHMFRNLIPQLADRYRVIAPDYPGFGHSAMPNRSKFAYTFDNYAQLVEKLDLPAWREPLHSRPIGARGPLPSVKLCAG